MGGCMIDLEDDETHPPVDSVIPDRVLNLFDPGADPDRRLEDGPEMGESLLHFIHRLGDGDIPEQSLIVVSHALGTLDAVRWALACCELVPDAFKDADRMIVHNLLCWLDAPEDGIRSGLLRDCLWRPDRSPAVLLGLAAGFTASTLAPQWPIDVPPDMCAGCVNEAVLAALAGVDPPSRDATITRFIAASERYI